MSNIIKANIIQVSQFGNHRSVLVERDNRFSQKIASLYSEYYKNLDNEDTKASHKIALDIVMLQ